MDRLQCTIRNIFHQDAKWGFHSGQEGDGRTVRVGSILSLCALIILGCHEEIEDDFAIYMLRDSTMTTEQAEKVDLSSLKLHEDPWLSTNDMVLYDFSTHCIYLEDDIMALFETDSITVFRNVFGTPFVVVANGERCYLGTFWTLVSSWMPQGPRIEDIDAWSYPKDVIHISRAAQYYEIGFDIRSDDRIEKALLQSNKLHAGLGVQLNDIIIFNEPDTSTVIYTFTVTNLDEDNLYIPDPSLMGSKLFHYYTNGITFNSANTHIVSEYKETKGLYPLDSWDMNWFVRIQSKHSLQMTATLKGYPHIPVGTYDCSFIYTGPRHIEKEQRILQDGRIWIGKIYSNVLKETVED